MVYDNEFCTSALLTWTQERKQIKSHVLESEEPFEIAPVKRLLNER